MPIDALLESLPSYAKDLKLNYSTLVRQNTELTKQQLWGTVVCTAIATRSDELTRAVFEVAERELDANALEAAKAAAAVMAMNNIYYRFHHLSENEKYATMPARLRMNVLRTHGVDPIDFELWSLAVSAINGCGKCVDSHEKTLLGKGATEELILAVVRVSAVIHGIGTVLDAERVTAAVAV